MWLLAMELSPVCLWQVPWMLLEWLWWLHKASVDNMRPRDPLHTVMYQACPIVRVACIGAYTTHVNKLQLRVGLLCVQ